ncbi:MAG: branched-chain amino acid ABC transporter permease [Chloroflexi bacterium]|nr:branched-chain amino acid ABC transporter permease [Chloroflexota bacterium]
MQKAERTPASALKIGLLYRLQPVLRFAGFSPLGLILLVTLAIVPLFIEDEYILRLLVVILLLGTQAMAFDFTVGFINVVNFGFAAFVGVGAYTSGLLAVKLGVSPWLGFIAAPVTAGLLGLLTGLLTLRLRGIYAAVMAWFVGLALMGLTAVNVDLTRGQLGLITPLLLDTAAQRPYFYIMLPTMIGTYLILRMVTNSHIGLAFRALGQSLEAARASGVNPTKYRVLNFTLSCALAGLLGVFYAHYVGILTPGMMHTKQTVEVLALAYIGGRGTLWGGLLAAFLVIPIFEYLKPLMEIRLIIYGLFVILTMIFYPGGLVGIIRGIGGSIRRRRASTVASE